MDQTVNNKNDLLLTQIKKISLITLLLHIIIVIIIIYCIYNIFIISNYIKPHLDYITTNINNLTKLVNNKFEVK